MTISLDLVDPELRDAAAALPAVDRTDVPGARRIFAARFGTQSEPADDVTTHEVSCRSADGAAVTLRVYRPRDLRSDGAVYHVHGGGFILGNLAMSHPRNVEIAREAGCVVVAVDYRLAPEHPFPTPVDDVYAGLVWLFDHAEELGVERQRIVLHGVSAGACLAAGTTLLARERGGPDVRLQFLASPVLDDRLTSRSSGFARTPALTRTDLVACWSAYLGAGVPGADTVPPVAAPARETDLGGLPPAYIAVAEHDPLRDEGLAYAQALLAAGVPVELHLFPGTFHGSSGVVGAAISRRERAEEIAVLRRFVGTTPRQGDRP
ncbi:alpha/beta hydrolase [Aeromicrobium alkaliterrae]|uniref:Alpha/beta hydrolase n=1 Tax=Aeromicrobium alkaliterrae TaxID=302168 RepID=A0ABP4VTE1_9ACTN